MHIHFIAIGGAAMHTLALALKKEGHEISGSDDEIFEPSRSRLAAANLLPEQEGWFPERIHAGIDVVVLGMHAKADNPELIRAEALGLTIQSYPAFFKEYTKHKTRVVVGGSHGKTTTTSMIIHGLQAQGVPFDCLVGASIPGIESPVMFDPNATLAIIEGDEYLASARQPIPKFHVYQGHIGVITGIAWDHVNVFKTMADYQRQFELFIDTLVPNGHLIYCLEDSILKEMVEQHPRTDIQRHGYSTLAYTYQQHTAIVQHQGREYPVGIQGRHNMQNLAAACVANRLLGGSEEKFLQSMVNFRGASKRMEVWGQQPQHNFLAIKDFAHSPSKVKATVQAVREAYPNHRLLAMLELHTYSSLSRDFLPEYQGVFQGADDLAVLYDPHALAIKRLPVLNAQEVADSMGISSGKVFSDPTVWAKFVQSQPRQGSVFLCMSSGNWGAVDMAGCMDIDG
ncbi:MAG: UDP-N-acetylmuramate--L-alanine ligase [Flavobacteriales bacterium]